jgi:hypothetical protein
VSEPKAHDMNWFERLMRNTGLMLHHTVKPLRKSDKQVVRKEVEETKVNDKVTLRRTTIEEIEIRRDDE